MSVNNPEGIEIHPGPRGHSVVSAATTVDGEHVRFTTDEPRVLNPVKLPRGPQGIQGLPGDPGEARIRVDEEAGRRVFLWDARTMSEQQVYGDTGVRLLADRLTWVRRVNNVVETNSIDPATDLPAGFQPVSPEAVDSVFTTGQAWPTELPGTEQAAPTTLSGLEGYDAAAANGYPGTAEEYLNSVYRVVLPPAGAAGQVLTRTSAGSAWIEPKSYGPQAWQNITLNGWTPASGSSAQARHHAGSVEMIGLLTYTGAQKTVGWLASDMLRIGVLPPSMAPEHGVDQPITSYRASDNRATIVRLLISTQGVVSIAAAGFGEGPGQVSFTAKPGVAQVNLSAISYSLRNSSPTA